MREHKYKCWDKKNKLMWKVTYITWNNKGQIQHIRGTANYYGMKDAPIGGHREFVDIDKYLILLEFTGLKDKNGKEIYEGDILKEILDDWEQIFLSEVVFVDGCFKTKTKDKRFNTYSYIDHTESTFEVIGNIYENPELLEEE